MNKNYTVPASCLQVPELIYPVIELFHLIFFCAHSSVRANSNSPFIDSHIVKRSITLHAPLLTHDHTPADSVAPGPFFATYPLMHRHEHPVLAFPGSLESIYHSEK